jgi:hypothetical protein
VVAEAPRLLSPPQMALLTHVRAEDERRAASVRSMADASGKKQPTR